MKKTVIIFIVVAAVLGGLLWWYLDKGKAATAKALPDAQKPPTAGQSANGLFSTESGAGREAIERRASEIIGTEKDAEITAQVRANFDPLKGVTEAKRAYYQANISRGAIVSPKMLPLGLSASAAALLTSPASIPVPTNEGEARDVLASLNAWNNQVLSDTGTSFASDEENASVQRFAELLCCFGYRDCGKNYKNMSENLVPAVTLALADYSKICSAWTSAVTARSVAIRNRAIEDLRGQGWKFAGIDQPINAA